MFSIFLMLLGWQELVCTFDAVQYGTTVQALQKECIPCRTRTIHFGSATQRTGTFYALGENPARSMEYQIFVKKAAFPKAQLVLQGRLHSL